MYVKFKYKEYNCTICTDAQKKIKGCYGDSKDIFEIEGIRYRTCPRKLITAQTWYYLELYQYYKDGFMLNGPAIIDQPSKYLYIMRFIDAELFRLHSEKE